MSHCTLSEVVRLPDASHEVTLEQLHAKAKRQLDSDDVVIEFSRDIVHKLVCPSCKAEEEVFAALGSLPYSRGACPVDGVMRAVITAHSFEGSGALAGRTLDQLGLPPVAVFVARS